MVLVDLHSKQSLMDLRSTQDDLRFGGSAQGAVTGHVGQPNPNVNHNAPTGSGMLYKGNGLIFGGRKMKKRRTRKHRKRHTRRGKRGKRGGYNVQFNPGDVNYLVGPSAGHASFNRGTNAPVHAQHKLGAGTQHQSGGGASLYPSPFGNSYYTTNMENTHALRGSYPEVVHKVHGCHTGGRRKSRKPRKSRSRKSRKHNVKRTRSRKSRSHKRRNTRRVRRGRNKKGGYHQYLNGSARSFGYLTNGKLNPQNSALAGHGLMGAYKMGDYGFKGNYNHFTGKNT